MDTSANSSPHVPAGTPDHLPEGVQRVASVLRQAGHPHAPVRLDDAARTAQQAADALGVALGQIAKSIIFRRRSDEVAVLVVTSGDKRVDEKKVERLVGAIGRADAVFVKEKTGFSIGGVPPLAHATASVTLIDQELFRFEEIWAAAGHPHCVFKLRPQDLCRLSDGPVADVVQGPPGDVVRSPCVSICRMSEASKLCEGCQRTIEEIIEWGSADDQGKRAILARIAQRRTAEPS